MHGRGPLARDGVTTKYSKGTKNGRDEGPGARRYLAKTLRRKGGKIATGDWDDYFWMETGIRKMAGVIGNGSEIVSL